MGLSSRLGIRCQREGGLFGVLPASYHSHDILCERRRFLFFEISRLSVSFLLQPIEAIDHLTRLLLVVDVFPPGQSYVCSFLFSIVLTRQSDHGYKPCTALYGPILGYLGLVCCCLLCRGRFWFLVVGGPLQGTLRSYCMLYFFLACCRPIYDKQAFSQSR